jgi:PSP1 C-terminal conserved region
MQSWNESFLSNPSNIPGSRYGDIKPPGTSRYGSLGTLGRSPNIHSSSPSSGSVVGNGYSSTQKHNTDISNMSPFVRDVGQILLDDGSAFRELWAGMNPPRDENGGGGSGTTSRRHSVSVVQPRRGNIVGFNVPGSDGPEEPTRPSLFQSSSIAGRGGLMLSDDDLASDLGLLNINPNEPPKTSSSASQPASLPIYAPLSRSPPAQDILSQYQSINLSGGGNSRQQQLGTPSDGGSGNSPSRNTFDQHFGEAQYSSNGRSAGQGQGQQQQHQSELMARFIPGQGIQYLPQQQLHQGTPNQSSANTAYTRARAYSNTLPSPISPTTPSRIITNPQQPPFYSSQGPGQQQRRPSDGTLSELGKGVPLHAVPASWPLFIVEFKAGRTDLFYLTDLSQDIRVGDLVIVEADRGKDLGKVVNDSITLAEVDAFQRQQTERAGDGQGSPGGAGGSGGAGGAGKKEINPKMIYGKAQPQDTRCVFVCFLDGAVDADGKGVCGILSLLVTKVQDELKALQLCQSKVRAKKLPMEVVDAEYQWCGFLFSFFIVRPLLIVGGYIRDRRKLTFYFVAEKRIDFRELVRELFRCVLLFACELLSVWVDDAGCRLYKTRIWMASLQGGGGFEQ